MHNFLQDLRFSLRLLARTPGFTAAAIAVLALGIGVNTAIFSVTYELLWSPRPYPDPGQVVQLYTPDTKNPTGFRLASYPIYRDLLAQSHDVFTGVLAHNLAMVGLGEGATSRRTFAAIVSSNYFSVLGVPLAQGRAFLPAEEKPGANIPVVIASDVYWQRTGRDPALIGKTIRVNERRFTVVGIAPPHFTGTMMLFGPELYFPLGAYGLLVNDYAGTDTNASPPPTLDRADAFNLFLVGRLRPGVTPAAANDALRAFATHLQSKYPVEQKDQTMCVGTLPRSSTSTNPSSERELTVLGALLLSMAAIVLLIACLNLANMLLARGAARRREIAVRLALGGGRARIVRQLVTEGFVLALGGGCAGLFLAAWSAQALAHSLAVLVPIALFFRGAGQPAIFAATLGFCTVATFFFALGPALKLSRTDIVGDLKAQPGDDAAVRRRRWRPRHPLVVAQIALSLALLTAAGLFVRGALKAGNLATGFRRDTIIAEVDAGLGGYRRPQTLQLYHAINERLATIPGVQACGLASIVPFGMNSMERDVRRAGISVAPGAHPSTAADGLGFSARWTSVSADFFAAAGLPLLNGRAFTAAETDSEGAPPVAIVDTTLARELFPDENPIGRHIQFADADTSKGTPPGLEIVGVVAPTRWQLSDHNSLGTIYVPFAQGYQSDVYYHLRAAVPATAQHRILFDTIRREIRAVAPGVPLFGVRTYQQHLDQSPQLWLVRAGATLFGLFGALALLLAALGIYGVNAYSVSRRTREIGIRMALGAEPGAVQRMILREGAAMTLAGIALGLLLGFGVGRACAGLLYRVDALDPYAFTIAPLVLAAAALAACWLPARRATKVEPIRALRAE